MGLELKIIENKDKQIVLTDFTVVDFVKKTEDIEGRNEFLSRNIIAIEIFGKYSITDAGVESKEVHELSCWAKRVAHEKDAYRKVELKLFDNNNKEYDTLVFEKVFLIEYNEKYENVKGFMDYYAFIRKFEDTEKAVKGVYDPTSKVGSTVNGKKDTLNSPINPVVVPVPEVTTTKEYAPSNKTGLAKLWINGKDTEAYSLNGSIYKKAGLFGKDEKIRDIAQKDGKEDCLSYWSENGIPHATYNSEMKDGAVCLVRKNNKVTVTTNLYLKGSYSTKTEPVSGKTYAELAYGGITGTWRNQTFQSNTYDIFGDDKYIEVKFVFNKLSENDAKKKRHIGIAIDEASQAITWDNVFWSGGNLGGGDVLQDIQISAEFRAFGSTQSTTLSELEFKNIAAHEFGHILGLGDAYKGTPQDAPAVTTEIPADEIMRGSWNIVKIYPNTIEMALEAFKLNALQKYDPNNEQSTVIRL